MQAVKDSFYMTLRQRLAQLYPARTFADDGRPAILVCENERESWAPSNDVSKSTSAPSGVSIPKKRFCCVGVSVPTWS